MGPLKHTIMAIHTLMLLTKLTDGFVYCPSWEYQPEKGGPCIPCSDCPKHQIVRETCSGTRDTVCGPFTEFKLFPKEKSELLSRLDDHTQSYKDAINSDNNVGVSESGSWQTITIVMICVLSVTGVLFMILVVITWHLCRRHNKDALITQTDQGNVI